MALPPHIHVTGNGGSAKVWLAPVRVAWFRAYNAGAVGEILVITRAHQAEWLDRWNEVCR